MCFAHEFYVNLRRHELGINIAITRNRNAELHFCSSFHYDNLLNSRTEGLRFEETHDGVQCHIVVVSFHCSIEHFHAEEGHCQVALQQRQVQRPKQCTPGGLPSSLGQALASHGPQDWQITYWRTVVQDGGSHHDIASLVAVGNLVVN